MPSDEMLAAYLAGMLAEPERLAFEELLLADPAARRELRSQQRISAALKALRASDGERMTAAILAATRATREAPPVIVIRKPRSLWPARALALAAAVVLCTVAYRFVVPPEAARVTREVAAVWSGDDLFVGDRLRPGLLKLRRGAVELEFSHGAKVMLEGPAELRLVSGEEAFLSQGRLRAVVPERAHGFTIRGKGFAAVDLGTEFGVITGDAPELHVFTGKVEFQGTSRRVLQMSEALRISGGIAESIPARPEFFADEKRLAAMEAGTKVDTHPSALVHYDFGAVGNTLSNLVGGRVLAAEVTGCRATEGRWSNKPALEFGQERDRVGFSLPSEMKSLTLLAWVRVDALPKVQSSLLMGSSELPGDLHWYLHRDGVLGFALVGPDGEWHRTQSPVVMRTAEVGQWKCLAVTYEGGTGAVTHYVDGHAVASQALTGSPVVNPGEVQVGNWALHPGSILRASKKPSPVDFQRVLQGRIDELAIFSTALDGAEIRRIWESGKP